MAEIINNPIPSIDAPWEGHTGQEVETFVKSFLQGLDKNKHGTWHVTSDESGMTTMRAFADEDAKEQYLEDPDGNSELILAEANFYTSGGSADLDYTLSARITQQPDLDMVKGASNILKFSYNSYFGGDTTDLDTQKGYSTVTINGTEVPELAKELTAGGNVYSIDLGPYMTLETNYVKLVVGNGHGKSRTFNFTIRSLEIILGLMSGFDESVLRTGSWNLRVSCQGVSAQVHVAVDGTEIAQSTITNSTNDFIIDSDGTLAAGAHVVTVYAVNSQYNIQTDTIKTGFIKAGAGTPAIGIGYMADASVQMYGTAVIPYYVYYPGAGNSSATVSFEVLDASGTKIADLSSQTLTLKADGTSGMQELRFAADKASYLSNGQVTIAVKLGTAAATHTIQILDAGVVLEPATECKIHLSAAGRTNADTDAEDWHSTYNGVRTCTVERSPNFKLTGTNGFVGDAFVIKSGKSITLDGFLPFGTDFGVNNTSAADRTGRTFEFEFMTVNCTDTDTKIIEAMSGGVGFTVYANRVVLSSTDGGTIETPISDEQKVRVGFAIDGHTTHCVNKTIDSTEESYANIAYMYLNGVIVRLMDYKTSTWRQTSPVKIKIGSDACDIHLYTVRIYDKSLNYQQMLGNCAYDNPDVSEKIAIATRNDILDSSNDVNLAKVLEALPDTPYKIWDISKMPTGKKDWQKATTDFVNPAWEANPAEEPAPLASFTCTNHDIALDGTSSLSYPDPYKNWADKYNGAWSVKIGNITVTITGYSITNGVQMSAKEFVDKVNFASSEGIFNILAANAYQNILLGTAGQYPELLTAKQASQQATGGAVTFRQSLSGFPEIGWLRSYVGGVPSIRFLSLYNFVNNKYDPYYFGFTNDGVNQLWEVEDNVNFFSEEIPEGTWSGGKWKDQATTLYYARVPKTSPTSGADFGKAANADGVTQANNESQWLRRFHNWVYSCNPNIAERYKLVNGTYKPLASSVTYGDTTYTHDTPAYRLAKFNAEHTQYINKSSALFYFVFFDWLLGVDSMDKNMTIGFENVTSGTPKAFFVQRDSDTLCQYGNRGTLLFKVYHEWGDSYNESTGETGRIEGEEYDPATQTFSVKTTTGSPVFNGRLSGLWDCVAQAWEEDVKAMYRAMRSNGLSNQGMWQLYNSFWGQWCEALYNTDAMGYANTGRFDMAHGDKREVVRYFFKYRQRYWDSKCGANTSGSLELRLWGTGKGVVLRYCQPLYASLNWGAGGIQTERQINAGEPSYFPSTGATFNETTFTVYDADLLTEICTYSEMPDGTKVEDGLQGIATSIDATGFENCKRLERLILDYSGKAANTNLSSRVTNIGSSIALRELVIRNCPNVTGTFNLQSENIQTIDLRDTAATGVTVPSTDALTSVQLPSTTKSIVFEDMSNLETLTLQGYQNVATIDIAGCPKLNTRNLMQTILNTTGNTLTNVRLRGIEWTNLSSSVLEKLADLGADITGHITISDTVSGALKSKLIAVFGNIDSEDNPLYVGYNIVPVSSIAIGGVGYIDSVTPIDNPKRDTLSIVTTPVNGNNISSVTWAVDANDYATIDSATGVLNVTAIGTEEANTHINVTATVTLINGNTMTATRQIGLYARSAHVGDYVYADGTYSDYLDTSKTVVGVCFYVNPYDKSQRLCVALSDVTSSICFGLSNNSNNGLPGITLADSPQYSVYDIATLASYQWPNMQLSDANVRDETTSGDPDGFKILSGAMAEIGFIEIADEFGGYPAGTQLPWGLVNTLKIIAHRNTILSDGSVNLPIPQEGGTTTMYQQLVQLMANVVANNGNQTKYQQYYYPAASLCNCYEPSVPAGTSLADCFKAGKWFLPSAGEFVRIAWYFQKGYDVTAENAIFAKAVNANLMSVLNSQPHYWTSTKEQGACFTMIAGSQGNYRLYYSQTHSYQNYEVRPIAVF